MTYRQKHPLAALLVIALLASCCLAVTGCGDDSSDDTSAAATNGNTTADSTTVDATDSGEGVDDGEAPPDPSEITTQAEYLAAGNAICADDKAAVRQEIVARFKEGPTGQDEEEALNNLVSEVIAPTFEGQIEEIEALGTPPGGGANEVQAMLSAIERIIKLAEEKPAVFAYSESPFASSQKLANAYGLTSCGQV